MSTNIDFVRRDYDINMSPEFVPRLNMTDFSDNGELINSPYSDNIVVVHFFVPICRFCQLFGPELVKFSKNYGKQVNTTVVAIDLSLPQNEGLIEKSKKFPYCLGEYYPTIIIFKNGKPCTSYLSFRTAEEIKTYIFDSIIDKPCPKKYASCKNNTNEGLEYKKFYSSTNERENNETKTDLSLFYLAISILILFFVLFAFYFRWKNSKNI